MKRLLILIIWSLAGGLTGCSSYPRLLNFPFDPRGSSLNSAASELMPQVASRYIVFVSDRHGSQDVYLYDAQNRRLLNLPGLNSFDEVASHPSISEDGRYIVFAASRGGRTGIFIYDRQTQQKRNLAADLAAEVRNPVISADGSRIAFEVARDGQWDIFVYDRSGQPLKLLP